MASTGAASSASSLVGAPACGLGGVGCGERGLHLDKTSERRIHVTGKLGDTLRRRHGDEVPALLYGFPAADQNAIGPAHAARRTIVDDRK